MKNQLICVITAALLATAAQGASAQDEMKPLVVASFAGWQEMIDDLDYVGEVSDNPDLGRGIEGLLTLITQGQGLDWIDKKQPWGLVVSTDGLEFQFFAFAPITDFETFLDIVSGFAGDPEEVEEGVYKLDVLGLTAYMTAHKKWTYISLGAEFMTDLPDDPTTLLAGLQNEYDLAVRIHVDNIPDVFRQLIIEQVRVGMEEGFEGALEGIPGVGDALSNVPDLGVGDSEQLKQMQKLMAEMDFDALALLLEETKDITIGLSIDREGKKAKADFTITAREDTATAKHFAELASTTTAFDGFMIEDAAVAMNVAMPLSKVEISGMLAAVGSFRSAIAEQLDAAGGFLADETARGYVDDFTDALIGIAKDTIEGGKVDGGLALVGEGPYTLLAGGYLPDTKPFSELIDKTIETVETEVGFYGFEKNVAEHKGVKFHKVVIPLPPGEGGDLLVTLFGESPELAIGVGEKSVFIAIGEGGIDKLKKVIDDSESASDEQVLPLRVSLAMGPLFELMDAMEADSGVLPDIDVDFADQPDRVDVTLVPIAGGVTLHVEAEEGLLQVLGKLMTSLGGALPQF